MNNHAWDMDDVPLGAEVRLINYGRRNCQRRIITQALFEGFTDSRGDYYNYASAEDNAEWRWPHIKDDPWKPCGKVVES